MCQNAQKDPGAAPGRVCADWMTDRMAVTLVRPARSVVGTRATAADTGGIAPKGRSQRNAAIDVLRGACIVMMITSHIGTDTWVNTIVHPLRFVSGAEGFVFLSGLVLGMVYRRKIAASGAWKAYRAIWKRASLIWLVHCVTVVLALAVNTWVHRYPDFPDTHGFSVWRLAWLTATLRFQPGSMLNILPLYVVLLGLAPLAFELLRRRMGLALLAGSFGLFLVTQYRPGLGAWVHPSCGGDAFPVPAWQFVFFGGLYLGYHSSAIRDRLLAPRRRQWMLGLSALCLVTAIVVWAQTDTFGFYNHAAWDAFLWERHPLRLGRLVYFLVAAGAFYLLVQRGLSSSRALILPAGILATLGRNSLYAFLVHLGVVFTVRALPVPAGNALLLELTQIAAVFLVYLMARHQVGRQWIPN